MFHLLDDLNSFLIFLKHSINNTLIVPRQSWFHGRSTQYCDERNVCLSLCLSASISQISPNFRPVFPGTVVQSSSGGDVIQAYFRFCRTSS